MNKDNLEESIKSLLNYMITEESNKSQKLIMEVLKQIQESKVDFSNPEDFHLFLIYKLENAIEEIAKHMHECPQSNIKDDYKPNFIFLHYDFLEHNIRELCTLREGSSCCADKSRSIIEIYLKYSLTGNIPEFNPDLEQYWTPKFGNYQEWMDLCDGIYELYFGKPEKYLRAYNVLLQTEIRRYKHILHHWYIKFKDEEIIEFDTTWDKRTDNPLDNKHNDKGDFYIMEKKLLQNRNYEQYKNEEELFMNFYCKVPKNDVKEIYKSSEEVLR